MFCRSNDIATNSNKQWSMPSLENPLLSAMTAIYTAIGNGNYTHRIMPGLADPLLPVMTATHTRSYEVFSGPNAINNDSNKQKIMSGLADGLLQD